MRSQPVAAQFLAILVLTDLAQYWIHRAFHARAAAVALPRRFIIRPSTMDWLAGSRLHLVDVAVTRGLTYVPIYVLGFAEAPLFAYVVFVSVQATFIHANVRFGFGPLRVARRDAAVPPLAPRRRSRRPSTRTSRCTCRSSTGCSARSICRRAAGRHRMGSHTARRCPKGTGASSSSLSRLPIGLSVVA